jgi:hypothetical protein
MKPAACIPTLEFGEFPNWPVGDPRREHLRGCARCQAELASYREFVQPPDIPPGARVEDAARAMRSAFGAELRRSHRRRLRWPYVAAAAAAIVLIGLLGPWRAAEEDLGPLRAGEPAAASSLVGLDAAVTRADGGLEFRWQAVEGADHYRLHLFDVDLREIGRPTTTTLTQLQVPAPSVAPRAWQVEALRGGVRIASSELVALP